MGAALDLVERRLRRNADYRATFGPDHGKRVLADLMRKGHMTVPVTVFDGDKRVDPGLTFYRDGTRHLVLYICRVLGMKDDEVQRLAQEEAEDD